MTKGISDCSQKIWDFTDFSQEIAAKDEYANFITYDDLMRAANEMNQTIGTRHLVFLVCSNTLESLVGYVACLNSGNVPIMISGDLDDAQICALYDIYHPEYIYAQKERESISILGDIILRLCKPDAYALYKTASNNSVDLHDDLALLLTTSGSTGSPKLVRQSYDNIKANTGAIVQYLELTQEEKPITTLPMNYTYGLSIINTHLAVGATLLITDKSFMQREFWNFFKEEGATSFGGVPYTYEILKKLRLFRMDLPSLRTMTQAGGKLSPELHKEFAEYAQANGKKFVVMYGQTEATARMAYLPAELSLSKFGSMGIAIPGGKFWLADADGNTIEESDAIGELIYEGANVTMGYAECVSDLKKGDENHGILHTGDMAKRDEDGYYYVVGRKKRFLKIYGKRINLDEVGMLLKGAFDGMDCVAAGKDDALHVFATDASKIDDVAAYVHEKFHISTNAITVHHIDQIPQNEAGKVMFRQLEQYYV